ncbi:MAG: hypothetical protein ACW97Z_01250 [Candidatus Hodarchaeales archaeon]|jgi:predicted glycosyl hydrolase (DUF1957 family)
MVDSNITKPDIAIVCHAYQPPNQTTEVLERIIHNCYLPVANMLEENPEIKITLNFNASLSEMLENGYSNIIEKYANLARNGQVEFLESGAYHPILPLLSEKEARFQITLNHQMNLRIFGSVWHPVGFWPPELAVSPTLLNQIENLGYQYSIVPEISIRSNSNHPTPLFEKIPTHTSASNLALIYRNRELSNNLSFKRYPNVSNFMEHVNLLKAKQPQRSVLIMATDLETFGEHHAGYEIFLKHILEKSTVHTIKDILNYPRDRIEKFSESSWSTSEEDLYRNIPYPLWAFPGNSIHEILNFHSDILSETLDFLLRSKDESIFEVRQALKEVAKAQYSCQTWWASAKDHFSKDLILKGFEEQKKALNITLKAIGSDYPNSIIKATSNRLEERLKRYLQRIM